MWASLSLGSEFTSRGRATWGLSTLPIRMTANSAAAADLAERLAGVLASSVSTVPVGQDVPGRQTRPLVPDLVGAGRRNLRPTHLGLNRVWIARTSAHSAERKSDDQRPASRRSPSCSTFLQAARTHGRRPRCARSPGHASPRLSFSRSKQVVRRWTPGPEYPQRCTQTPELTVRAAQDRPCVPPLLGLS